MKMMMYVICSLLLLAATMCAQELNCIVTMKQEGLPSQALDNLTDFVNQVTQYLNSYRWTNVDLGGEQIKCQIDVAFSRPRRAPARAPAPAPAASRRAGGASSPAARPGAPPRRTAPRPSRP